MLTLTPATPHTRFTARLPRPFAGVQTSLEYYADGSGIDIKGLILFSTVTKLEQDVHHSQFLYLLFFGLIKNDQK